MKKITGQYRQGDVLLTPTQTSTDGAKKQVSEDGRIILARGEATGHHHSLASRFAALMVLANRMRILHLDRPTEMEHQEHGTIPIPAGDREVRRQREFDGEYSRQVAD